MIGVNCDNSYNCYICEKFRFPHNKNTKKLNLYLLYFY